MLISNSRGKLRTRNLFPVSAVLSIFAIRPKSLSKNNKDKAKGKHRQLEIEELHDLATRMLVNKKVYELVYRDRTNTLHEKVI